MKITNVFGKLFRSTSGLELKEVAIAVGFISFVLLTIVSGVSGKVKENFKKAECAAKGQDIRVAGPGSPERFQCVPRQQSGR